MLYIGPGQIWNVVGHVTTQTLASYLRTVECGLDAFNELTPTSKAYFDALIKKLQLRVETTGVRLQKICLPTNILPVLNQEVLNAVADEILGVNNTG